MSGALGYQSWNGVPPGDHTFGPDTLSDSTGAPLYEEVGSRQGSAQVGVLNLYFQYLLTAVLQTFILLLVSAEGTSRSASELSSSSWTR